MAARSTAGLREAHDVLDDAIRANQRLGAVCLGLAIAAAVAGIACVLVGAIRGNWPVALAGVALGGLSWPARLCAGRARGANTVLRSLEAPLSMNDTPTDIAQTLSHIYESLGDVLGETRWLVRPKHTLGSVVGELAAGLKDGTIVIDKARSAS